MVAGISRYPKRVGRKMGIKKRTKRINSMKCFVKYMNVNHIMPTRYTTSDKNSGNLEVKSIFKKALKDAGTACLTVNKRRELAK